MRGHNAIYKDKSNGYRHRMEDIAKLKGELKQAVEKAEAYKNAFSDVVEQCDEAEMMIKRYEAVIDRLVGEKQ